MGRTKVKSGDGKTYSFNTLKLDCEKCNEGLKHKCNWEQRTRTAIMIEYPDMLCQACKEKIDMKIEE